MPFHVDFKACAHQEVSHVADSKRSATSAEALTEEMNPDVTRTNRREKERRKQRTSESGCRKVCCLIFFLSFIHHPVQPGLCP